MQSHSANPSALQPMDIPAAAMGDPLTVLEQGPPKCDDIDHIGLRPALRPVAKLCSSHSSHAASAWTIPCQLQRGTSAGLGGATTPLTTPVWDHSSHRAQLGPIAQGKPALRQQM